MTKKASGFSGTGRCGCCIWSSRRVRCARRRRRWALHLLRHAESVLGFALTRRQIGGRGGGGSALTEEAKAFMAKYENYREECVRADRERFARHFPDEV